MKRILILLLIQILPAHCLATTTNNDSFKMYIEAISLNNQISTTYIPFEGTKGLIEKEYRANEFDYTYYPEALISLKDELKKINYKEYIPHIKKPDEGYPSSIVIRYYTKNYSTICIKYIGINSFNVTNSGFSSTWFVDLTVADESFNFRYYIPSMIKCAGKYFNKNFKGIVTCKR